MQTPSVLATTNNNNVNNSNAGNKNSSATPEFSFDKILQREMGAPNLTSLAQVSGASAQAMPTANTGPVNKTPDKVANTNKNNGSNSNNTNNTNSTNASNSANNANSSADANDKVQDTNAGPSENASIAKGEPSPNASKAGSKDASSEDTGETAASDSNTTLLGSAMPADMLALVASFNQTAQKAGPAKPEAPDADALKAGANTTTAGADSANLAQLEANLAGGVEKSSKAKVSADTNTDADAGFATTLDQAALAGKAALASGKESAKTDAALPLDNKLAAELPQVADGGKKVGVKLDAAEGIASSKTGAAGAQDALPKMSDILAANANKAANAGPDLALASRLADNVVNTNVIAPSNQANAQFAQIATVQAKEQIAPTVGSEGWDQAVGQKVVWMVAGGQQTAELTLNPPDMGPMQVVLSVNNDQASVTFSAAQPEVRQALEAAMPKLREMMSEAGVNLTSSSVNTGMPNQQQQANSGQNDNRSNGSSGNGSRFGSEDASKIDSAPRVVRTSRISTGLGAVDTFA
ncbi:MAG: flagellar hook-length control protein FliK [Burkholderiales bacterium]|nr:flagellar hook-length control protein FliK [Burkholderiales bacterium]